jgi:hypothetical protein
MALSLAELETESASVLPSRDTMFVIVVVNIQHNTAVVIAPAKAVAVSSGGLNLFNNTQAAAGASVGIFQA